MKRNDQAVFVLLCPRNTAVFKVPHPHGLAKGTNNVDLAKDVHQSGRIFGSFKNKKPTDIQETGFLAIVVAADFF